MRVLSVAGITGSGKTTIIENIITELTKRRYSVGSIKEIHYEKFAIDEEGTNTDRHYKAGADLVTARGYFETDILYKKRLSVQDILRQYDHDYVVLEGVEDFFVPKIISAHNIEEIEAKLDETVFAISGRISNEIEEYQGIPVINTITNIDQMVDLIEQKVFPALPNLPEKCCGTCGYSCKELTGEILRGERDRNDCPIGSENSVQLKVDGHEIDMVPFVQDILRNAVEGVVKELDGYKKNARIEITIGDKNGTSR
ncbi:molybdopterin-guanine dinucleotide biosynthesis protein MobB [Natranaerobius thermophilus]|uniref:Molybdopterin-guanine dinucleotide biosynthesis protein n=1 Tax=Natranaerobius thermophilus (strain ATCC BAA-1301 / DSM 18059 / JW/NM-WN-LF) TaxID=457570 RepID=B2A5A1_NATTJ|nr:molybdopterin-guanine dinucleotide biosynthesis protein MobB [Natranaerobius thermophilus]ACB83935.1 molybdopterin-guanine dinucleotide biosynthesis protein [Natranaerobius thermophilus JW/NM-WN-LF]